MKRNDPVKYSRDIIDQLGIVITSQSGDELRGLCPIHGDTDPSLNINLEKGVVNCFPAGTRVIARRKTANQFGECYAKLPVPIEDIRIGDTVLSYNEKTSKKEWKKVTWVFRNKVRSFANIKFSNGNELVSTVEHPIAVSCKGKIEWSKAEDIKISDKCIQYRYSGLTRRLSGLACRGKASSLKGKTYEEIHGYTKGKKRRAVSKQRAIERCKNPEYIEKISKAKSANWEDPKYRRSGIEHLQDISVLGVQKQSIQTYMNYPERRVSYILRNTCPGEFHYNGNFRMKTALNGLVPDFVNVNGKKKVIEVFGNYWHGKAKTGTTKSGESRKRINRFKSVGYDCLILWEKDILCDIDGTKQKIENFVHNPDTDIVKVVSKKIEYLSEEVEVYNLEVEDNNNYFAYGILVHNCWGACQRGWPLWKFIQEVSSIPNRGVQRKVDNQFGVVSDVDYTTLPMADDTIAYLRKKGITKGTIKKWDIRFGGASLIIPAKTRKRKIHGLIYRVLVDNAGFPRYMYSKGFSRDFFFGSDHYSYNI
jgi:very-short-patch-repair endonuclease